MNETTEACIRGCSMRNRHLVECEGIAYNDAGEERPCRGCLPRRAEHGHLCWPCHRRLELTLHDAAVVDRWLGAHMAGSTTAQIRDDFERPGSHDLPDALRLQVYDQRQALRDQYACWVDDLCEREHLTGPARHTVEADADYLMQWLGRIEYWPDIAEVADYVYEQVSLAHALAPWRPVMRRVSGVPCPECAETNLVIYGGESDVTCMSCHTMILEKHMDLWVQIVREEQEAS